MHNPRRFVATLLLPALLAACSEPSPLGSAAALIPAPAGLARLECTASVRARTLACKLPATRPSLRAIIFGGQEQKVRLTTENVLYDSVSGIFRGDVTVRNLEHYPLGTSNGTVADSGGVKVFFNSGPVTTGGSGNVVLQNADGEATFTAANQPYFKYPELLGFNQESSPRTWRFQLDPGVTDFSFTILLEAQIPASAFHVLEPGYGAIIHSDTLRIVVRPLNPAVIDSMRATVLFRSTLLALADSGLWKGKIYIPGVGGPDDETLRVVAYSPSDSTVMLVLWDDDSLEGIRRQ